MDNHELHFLPPMRGSCPICGAKHKKGTPHDVNSVYYRTKFRQKYGRYPTQEDAAKHCNNDERPKHT